jgi:uncharacterized OB-fold protein
MANEFPKPAPHITNETKLFWEGSKNSQLMLNKCVDCGYFRNPVTITANICPKCGSRKPAEWVKSSGKGKIHTFTAVHRTFHPAFEKDLPYIIAIVELEEGPRFLANLKGISSDKVRLNMPVEVFFEKLTEEITLPQFKPA